MWNQGKSGVESAKFDSSVFHFFHPLIQADHCFCSKIKVVNDLDIPGIDDFPIKIAACVPKGSGMDEFDASKFVL